jgi:3-phosphoshikimate 1-carboxyvinyltransferase
MANVIVKNTVSLTGQVCAPPSKAYTQRMVVAAALSKGTSKVISPLFSEDTEAIVRAVKTLGAKVLVQPDCWIIGGKNPEKGSGKPINCGESGATLRFMIPVAALAATPSVFILGKGLSKRPIEPLLKSIRQLGVQAESQLIRGKATVRVEGGGLHGGKTNMPGDVSSQFVSGLMFACPLAEANTEIMLTSPLESKSYVLMTEAVLNKHGINVEVSEDFKKVKIPSKQTYHPCDSKVPGDFSSAAFVLAAAAIIRSEIRLMNLDFGSIQGDKAIVPILQKMGVNGKVCEDKIELTGKGTTLNPIDVDARDIPDLVPVCTTLACFANGTSRIHDAQRLRLKESDRLASLFGELQKMGADIAMDESSLTINGPCKLHGAFIDPHNDHRIAMACTIAGLNAEGETIIQDAECVRKSYPQFFTDLHSLGADVVGGEFIR